MTKRTSFEAGLAIEDNEYENPTTIKNIIDTISENVNDPEYKKAEALIRRITALKNRVSTFAKIHQVDGIDGHNHKVRFQIRMMIRMMNRVDISKLSEEIREASTIQSPTYFQDYTPITKRTRII